METKNYIKLKNWQATEDEPIQPIYRGGSVVNIDDWIIATEEEYNEYKRYLKEKENEYEMQ